MKLDGVNPPLQEEIFFKKLLDDIVRLRIIEISEIKKSDYVKGSYYIKISFEIMENIKGFYKGDIVNINFMLSDKISKEEYRIKHNAKIYPLINYAYVLAEAIPKGTNQGIILTEEEIRDCLKGLEFIGMPDHVEPKFNKPFYILRVLT